MLKNLLIKNYALIQHLEMSPSAELNIITGETGAGKSIMLGALGLLLGNRADTKVLLNEEEKCIIEGSFDIKGYKLEGIFDEEGLDYDELCLIRREISPQNKSRAFINDTPVTLEVLKKIGGRLLDIHSQHETLFLGNPHFQVSVLDAFAGNDSLLNEYKACFRQHKDLERQYSELSEKAKEARQQFEFNQFLLTELTQANLISGEQGALEEELQLLENAGEIKARLNQAVSVLSGEAGSVLSGLQFASKCLEAISSYSKQFEELKTRLDSANIELKDIAAELEREEEKTEFNAERTDEVNNRLSLLYNLQQKHMLHTVDDLLSLQESLGKKVKETENLDEELDGIRKKSGEALLRLNAVAQKLSDARQKVTGKIKKQVEEYLKEVGMPNATFDVRIEPTEPGASGADKVSFLFSANKGVAPQELKQVASGGEFSRLMLTIKYILAGKTQLPTIIFDEIDTGISGEIAIKVANLMRQMAANHQVLAISHLPQIAAKGTAHYYVYKDDSSSRAISKIKKLSEEERVKEIAQMIGGEKPSETSYKGARELLGLIS